jgi:hypothetical protein
VAATLRELMYLDVECERLVFQMHSSAKGTSLSASAEELDELLGFIAANANHETNRRRQKRLDASFDALTEALRAVESPDALTTVAAMADQAKEPHRDSADVTGRWRILECDANRMVPTVDGQRRPRSTPLVAAFMRNTIYSASYSLVYALTSATTHGTHFALMRSYVDSGDKHDGESILDRRLDHRQIEPVCGVVLEAFAATMPRIVQLAGWGWTKVDGYQSPIHNFLYTMPY